MARTAASTSSDRSDAASRANRLSSTAPAAPPITAPAAVRSPIPPAAHISRSTSSAVKQVLQQDERSQLADPAAGFVALGGGAGP
jgi:hypothetical protein